MENCASCLRRLAAEGLRRLRMEEGGRLAADFTETVGIAGRAMDSRFGEGAAARVHGERASEIGAALCHGAGRLRDVLEREMRGRSGAGSGMDGLPRAGCLSDVRRDGLDCARRERNRGAACAGLVRDAARVVPAAEQLRRDAAGAARAVAHRAHGRQRGVGGDGRELAGFGIAHPPFRDV